MEKRRRKRLILCLLLVLLLLLILLLSLKSCHKSTPPEPQPIEESEEPKTLDFEAASEQEKITIPAVTGLNMAAGQTHQAVDFYNPETNNCYFRLSLYLSDDTLLFQSDYLKPSEHITEIDISQTLKMGTYKNCRLVFDCYTLDEEKEPLNSGTVILQITAR